MPMPMVKKQSVDEMNEAIKETPEYKLGKRMLRDVSMQFGGDTGIDADYYDENNEKYISEPIKEDMLKLMDKVDSLEQMIYNLNAKTKDQYKLVNDRINVAFDIIKTLERK